MALQKLCCGDRAAFEKVGLKLTPEQEHVAAVHATTINWVSLITLGIQVVIQVLDILGVVTPTPTPTPTPAS